MSRAPSPPNFDDRELRRANAQFFKERMLDPAAQSARFSTALTDRASGISVLEGARWLRLGVRFQALDPAAAFEAVSSATQPLALARAQLNRSGEDNLSFALARDLGYDDNAQLSNERFARSLELKPEDSKPIADLFGSYAMLASETIADPDVWWFLDAVGWSNDSDWEKYLRAEAGQGVQSLFAGLARVTAYFENFHELSMKSFASLTAVDEAAGLDFATLQNAIHELQGPRFQLQNERTRRRYFQMAGYALDLSRDNSPEWLDARRATFDRLKASLGYFGGHVIQDAESSDLWRVFSGEDRVTAGDLNLWDPRIRFNRPRERET